MLEQELLSDETIQWSGRPNQSARAGNAAVFSVPFLVFAQYLLWVRFIYGWWMKGRTYYVLTNRRALTGKFGWSGREVLSTWLDGELVQIDKRVRADGIGRIAFNGRITTLKGRGSPPDPPMFEDIDDCDAVYRLAITLRDTGRR